MAVRYKAALDVGYEKDRATAACIVFEDWQDSAPKQIFRAVGKNPRQYRAGNFYERELPYLLTVLSKADQQFDTIIIDGYVHLRPDVGKGLGVHLIEELSYSPVVIGVAKSPLRIAERFLPIYRGRSKNPLYVSAMGCALDLAAGLIEKMHGPHRIPTLLKLTDLYTKTNLPKNGIRRDASLCNQH